MYEQPLENGMVSQPPTPTLHVLTGFAAMAPTQASTARPPLAQTEAKHE